MKNFVTENTIFRIDKGFNNEIKNKKSFEEIILVTHQSFVFYSYTENDLHGKPYKITFRHTMK